MIIVSACLSGSLCRWDGKSSLDPDIKRMAESGEAIVACPEVLGGLTVPREPAEIVGGGGVEVLEGKARVVTRSGRDVTREFMIGAKKFLEIARRNGATRAILKEKSPSCGFTCHPDGTFSKSYRSGPGVTAALLVKEGIEIISK